MTAVGSSLHTWSLVELQMAIFFAELMGFDNDRRSHAIFGAIVSFEVRLAICDRLVALQPLSELDQELWSRVSSKLRVLYKKRHAIAHFTVSTDNVEIRPFLTTEKLRTGEGISTLNIAQILERSKKFIELRESLRWFGTYIILTRTGHQERRLAALEEPPPIARFRELASLNLAKRERRENNPPQ